MNKAKIIDSMSNESSENYMKNCNNYINNLVSVVVPCYNCESFVRDTLESIRKQTYLDFECILVDDSSTDTTNAILAEYVKKDSRFRLIKHRLNSGLAASRNTGARSAIGQYLCFLDSDDLMMPESLELRRQALTQDLRDNVAGTYCGSVTIKENTKNCPSTSPLGEMDVITYLSSQGKCPFNANQPMLYTQVFKKLGGFNESLKQAEDYDLWARILRSGFIFIPTKFKAVTYRARESSMIRKGPLEHLANSLDLNASFYNELPLNSFYSSAYSPFYKAGQNYQFQADVAARVFEFIGMAIANKNSEGAILKTIIDKTPDLFKVIDEDKAFQYTMYGVRRYFPQKSMSFFDIYNEQIQKNIAFLKKQLEGFSYRNKESSIMMQDHPINEMRFGKWGSAAIQKSIDIIFFPHKDYHVWTVNLLSENLSQMGFRYAIVDFSANYRDEGVRAKAKELNIDLLPFNTLALGEFRAKLLVAFNDWDPIIRSIFNAAFDAGIATATIVEGIQDYHDVDTGRVREPYCSSELVLVPGEFDAKYFNNPRQSVVVGGVPRILELYKRPVVEKSSKRNDRKPRALINSNFSYNVLVDKRDDWLTDAVQACKDAGFDVIISRHPADLGKKFPELVSKSSFYDLLEEVDVTIQRFASGILESLARRVPVIYFNPHGEKVDKFKDSMNAYIYTEKKEELTQLLLKKETFLIDDDATFEFLNKHSNISDENISLTICSKLGDKIKTIEGIPDWDRFLKNIYLLDFVSGVFTDNVFLNKKFKAIFGKSNFSKTQVRKIFDDLLCEVFSRQNKKNNIVSNLKNDNKEIALPISESQLAFTAEKKSPNLNLRKANCLFRAGDFKAAMTHYLLLYKQQPLKIYADNALLSARRLGMKNGESLDVLIEMFDGKNDLMRE